MISEYSSVRSNTVGRILAWIKAVISLVLKFPLKTTLGSSNFLKITIWLPFTEFFVATSESNEWTKVLLSSVDAAASNCLKSSPSYPIKVTKKLEVEIFSSNSWAESLADGGPDLLLIQVIMSFLVLPPLYSVG